MNLIRNSSHGNGVAIFVVEENNSKYIVKATTSRTGILNLEKEIAGWDWYSEKLNVGHCEILNCKKKYLKIKIPYIEGKKASYSAGIIKNKKLVRKIIQHYVEVWGNMKTDEYPLHGDLSIDNVIFNDNGIYIIDWEYFLFNATPFGFDAYNLIFEQLLFSMKGRKKPNEKEIGLLLENINLIKSAAASSKYFDVAPLEATQNFIRKRSDLWANQTKRLPVLYFKSQSVENIDKLIYACC